MDTVDTKMDDINEDYDSEEVEHGSDGHWAALIEETCKKMDLQNEISEGTEVLAEPLLTEFLEVLRENLEKRILFYSRQKNFYSTGIIHQLGVSLKMAAIFNVLILRFPSIIFMLLILVLSRKLKSRPYLLGSLIGGLISITLLFCVQLYDHFIPNSQLSAGFGLASLFLGISCWHLGSGYLPKFLPAECCPQISRSQTTAYQVAVRGFTSIIITVLYPTLAAAIGGPLALLPVMICGYLSVAWLFKYLPETKDKSVDEVVKEWMDPDSECEAYPIIGGEVQQPPDDLTLSLTLSVEC